MCRFAAAAVCTLLAVCVARAENWPQWRGPNDDGISSEKNLPTKWTDKDAAWTLPMPGMGGATPCVWGDRIFLTSEDGSDIVLLCVSTAGKELWRQRLGGPGKKARAQQTDAEGNSASASPSTDGKHVWAFAGSGDLGCYDFDGHAVWKFNLQDRYGKFNIQFGMHSTPVLYEDRLYLQLLHTDANIVVALEKASGKEVWKVDRPSDSKGWECPHSYASAMMWHSGKDAYLVTHGNDYTVAHDLKDGHEVWRLGGLNPPDHYNSTLRFVATPLVTPELIVVPTAKHGAVVAVKPEAKGSVSAGSPYEQWRLPKGTPDVPSPLLHDGLVYLMGESGTLTCLDAKTGQEKYTANLLRARFRASPVYADGKVYIASRDKGTVFVVKAGPKYELLAANEMPDIFTASPVISNGRIYLRGFKTLYAIGGK